MSKVVAVDFKRKKVIDGDVKFRVSASSGRPVIKIDNKDYLTVYGFGGELLVTIDCRTGKVNYTHDELMDAGSKAFWSYVAHNSPLLMVNDAEDNNPPQEE